MDLDGNDEKEENNEEDPMDLNLPEDENIELPDEDNFDHEEQIEEQNEKINSAINPIPDDLPDQQQEQLEQSALTQDKTSNVDSTNQPNDLQKSFANAETFEDQKNSKQQENIGESSSTKSSQTQQISSNQQNQLTQQLNNESQSENINKNSNQSNEQRTLSQIASLIDQNIKAAFDLEQTDENNQIDDIPTVDNTDQQTQIYAHAKNIPKDLSQQKQILDSATDQQTKDLNEQDNLQTTQPEPMIIDNQQQEQDQSKPLSSTLQKEPINKTKSSSTHEQSSSLTDENNQMIYIDKPYIPTTTVEHQFDFISHVKPLTNNLTEQIEYQLEEWYTQNNQHIDDENDAEQLWTQLEYLTQPYVFELCEQLRLLLEPTQRTKYSGDYRTGKRLNMKRIISYIASDFRKDRIWLRRSKPSKRQYQLILAIDDSQSMDNLQVKRLALESLILLGQTLNLLDIGQFGIVSFGQYIQILQPLSQTFNHQNGIQVLKQLKFNQTKTLLADVRIEFFF
jgi:midasin